MNHARERAPKTPMSHISEKKHSDKRAIIFESNSPASDPYAQNEPHQRRESKIGTATDF